MKLQRRNIAQRKCTYSRDLLYQCFSTAITVTATDTPRLRRERVKKANRDCLYLVRETECERAES